LINGKREGNGKMIYPKDNNCKQYEGDWHLDKWHGKGILIANNSRYEGDFISGERHGFGK